MPHSFSVKFNENVFNVVLLVLVMGLNCFMIIEVNSGGFDEFIFDIELYVYPKSASPSFVIIWEIYLGWL